MLFGQRIKVFTDHKNLTSMAVPNFLMIEQVLHQRLLLEEYGPEIVHIDGEANVAADTLSRNPQRDKNCVDEEAMEVMVMEAMANEQVRVPIDYRTIYETQSGDPAIKSLRKKGAGLQQKQFGKYKLWMRKSANDGKFCIFIPKELRNDTIE